MRDRFFDAPERAAVYVLALVGAVALLLEVIVDSAVLNIAGGLFIGSSFLWWGLAHLANREWTRPTHGDQRRWVAPVFVLLGLIILGFVVADLAAV